MKKYIVKIVDKLKKKKKLVCLHVYVYISVNMVKDNGPVRKTLYCTQDTLALSLRSLQSVAEM